MAPGDRERSASGRALLENHPGIEKAHAVGNVAGKAHLVGCDHHRHALGRELAYHLEHFGDKLGVECAGDLVEQHQPGFHRECTHDRDPLLLAAGQMVRVGGGLVGQPEPLEQLEPGGLGVAAARP